MIPIAIGIALSAGLALVPTPVRAASLLDGTTLSWPWSLPFIGVLLSIAAGPLWFPLVPPSGSCDSALREGTKVV